MTSSELFTYTIRTRCEPLEKQGNISFVSYMPHRCPDKSQDSIPSQGSQPPITLGLGVPACLDQPALYNPLQTSGRNS